MTDQRLGLERGLLRETEHDTRNDVVEEGIPQLAPSVSMNAPEQELQYYSQPEIPVTQQAYPHGTAHLESHGFRTQLHRPDSTLVGDDSDDHHGQDTRYLRENSFANVRQQLYRLEEEDTRVNKRSFQEINLGELNEESTRDKQSRIDSLIAVCGFRGDEWFVRKNPLRDTVSDESKEKAKAFFLRCTKAIASLIGGQCGSDWLLEDFNIRNHQSKADRCGENCKARKVMLEVAYHGSPLNRKLAKAMLCSAFESRRCQQMQIVVDNQIVYPAKANEKTYTRYRKDYKDKVLKGMEIQLMKEHPSHIPSDKVLRAAAWISSTCTPKSGSAIEKRKVLGTFLENMPNFLTSLSTARAFELYKEHCAETSTQRLGYPGFRELWSTLTEKHNQRRDWKN